MNSEISKNTVLKKLKIVFWSNVVLLLLSAAVVEYLLIDEMGGAMTACVQFEFVYQTLLIVVSFGAIFLSLRLFRFSAVEKQTKTSLSHYYKWSLFRLTMLVVPLVLNILGYLFFLNASFAWMGVVLGLAMPFVYPSEERFILETSADNE